MFKKLYDSLFKKPIKQEPKKDITQMNFSGIIICDDYDKNLIKRIINDNLEGHGIEYVIKIVETTKQADSKNISKFIPVLYFNSEYDYNMFLMIHDGKESFNSLCSNEFNIQLQKLFYNRTLRFSADTRQVAEITKLDILKETKNLNVNCKILIHYEPIPYYYVGEILFESIEDYYLIESNLDSINKKT